jgi:hypothetical protein
MNAVAAYGLLAHGLIFGALVALLPLGGLRQRAALTATALALIAGIAPVMHGTFGTPSLTLLQLALLHLANRAPSPFTYRPALGLLIFALLFYPAALGWGASTLTRSATSRGRCSLPWCRWPAYCGGSARMPG